ncbi:MAG: ribonuclease HII [Treponema sp.]|nr:ribonuclease HII [Spirochaetia bacterium]MDY2840386.1 ribonuclease HII [Treponema sp.]
MDFKILETGFDEAGRGPLAGPVSAGCVILPEDFPFEILNDSKKLSEKKREAAEIIIKEKACWGIGLVDHETIDRINILNAAMLAMKIAYEQMLEKLPQWCKDNNIDFSKIKLSGITDGTKCPEVPIEIKCEPKADGNYTSVMAASILAKTCRDRIMIEMDKKYPQYGYARHKGYPTRDHKEICRKIGPSPIQRLSFKY